MPVVEAVVPTQRSLFTARRPQDGFYRQSFVDFVFSLDYYACYSLILSFIRQKTRKNHGQPKGFLRCRHQQPEHRPIGYGGNYFNLPISVWNEAH